MDESALNPRQFGNQKKLTLRRQPELQLIPVMQKCSSAWSLCRGVQRDGLLQSLSSPKRLGIKTEMELDAEKAGMPISEWKKLSTWERKKLRDKFTSED